MKKKWRFDPIEAICILFMILGELFREARHEVVIERETRERTDQNFHKYIGELESAAKAQVEAEKSTEVEIEIVD